MIPNYYPFLIIVNRYLFPPDKYLKEQTLFLPVLSEFGTRSPLGEEKNFLPFDMKPILNTEEWKALQKSKVFH